MTRCLNEILIALETRELETEFSTPMLGYFCSGSQLSFSLGAVYNDYRYIMCRNIAVCVCGGSFLTSSHLLIANNLSPVSCTATKRSCHHIYRAFNDEWPIRNAQTTLYTQQQPSCLQIMQTEYSRPPSRSARIERDVHVASLTPLRGPVYQSLISTKTAHSQSTVSRLKFRERKRIRDYYPRI